MLDRRGDAALELVIIVAVQQVVLAIVLILHHGVGLRQPCGKQVALGVPFDARAIGIATPVEIDIGQIGAVVPDLLVDHRL